MRNEKSLFFLVGARAVSFAILLLSIFFAPWWFSFLLYVIGLFLFERFYEGVLALSLMDLLYGIPEGKFYGFPLVATLFAVIFYYAVFWVKGRLSMYS
jgi:hypothetical protein